VIFIGMLGMVFGLLGFLEAQALKKRVAALEAAHRGAAP
jgi:hypothetical protein